MSNEFLTQRDFAAVTGLSPSTIVKLTKDGTIYKNAMGHIPKSEVLKAFLIRIKKYAEFGTLIITFDKSDEELEILKQRFLDSVYAENVRDTVRCYTGVRNIVGVVTKSSSSMDAKIIQEQYNKTVLSLFANRYIQMIDSYFCNLVSTRRFASFNALTVSDAYEYLMFGNFSNDTNEIRSFLGDSDVVNEISQYILLRFESIMSELCITGKDSKPLFTRQMITDEFLKARGSLYNSFFLNANGERDVTFINRCPKVESSIIKLASGKRTKSNIDNVLSDGFVSIINVDSSCANILESGDSYAEGDILSEACCGVYGRIIITKSAKELSSCSENGLNVLPLLLEKTSSTVVIYDEGLC